MAVRLEHPKPGARPIRRSRCASKLIMQPCEASSLEDYSLHRCIEAINQRTKKQIKQYLNQLINESTNKTTNQRTNVYFFFSS
jgi:hypothetical protein